MVPVSPVSPQDLAALTVFAEVPIEHLAPLAGALEPLSADRGTVLMREGEQARSFLIVASGEVEVRHTDVAGTTVVEQPFGGPIVGEIALLRDAPRAATLLAATDLRGYVGRQDAFHRLLEIPGIADQLVRTARQRLAELAPPIPIQARDGTELLLRPVLPGDTERVVHGHVRFSPETLYRRFLSARTVNEALLRYLTEVDYVDHFVWVVTDSVGGSVIADARFVRDHDDPAAAEIAFTVADDYQGRGFGTMLFWVLVVTAHVDGVERFTATALSENRSLRAILDHFDADWVREDGGAVTTTIDVPTVERMPDGLPAAARIADVARQVIQAFD